MIDSEQISMGKRTDARRNYAQLLKVATVIFREHGVAIPMKEIARHAGIGVGTLYRHFPRRSDLIVAVFRNEVNECAEAAERLSREYSPIEAFEHWIEIYTHLIITKRGLAAALHSSEPAYAGLPEYFETHLIPPVEMLIQRAGADINGSIGANDLLRGIALLCSPATTGDLPQTNRLVKIFITGIGIRSVASLPSS